MQNANSAPLSARRSGPLKGTAQVPGDKSISQRALILGALAQGETRITGLLESGDVHSTAGALRGFGAELTPEGPGRWRVKGTGVGNWRTPAAELDFGMDASSFFVQCTWLAKDSVTLTEFSRGDEAVVYAACSRINCSSNQSRASDATRWRAPGSSKR